jgi:hypothetical protein
VGWQTQGRAPFLLTALALGSGIRRAAPHLVGNAALRERLMTFMLEDRTSTELSDWLRDLDADTRDTVDEKKSASESTRSSCTHRRR